MNCPVCGAELLMAECQGVDIDCCPECRGVWINHGDLDKIIDRSAARTTGFRFSGGGREPHKHHESEEHRRKSFFRDLFE